MRALKSSLLSVHKNLVHAFSTKENGNSKAPFSQNNLAYHVNDNSQTVYKNHLNYANYLNYDINRLVHMNQVHGNKVIIIDKQSDLNSIPQCDALITQETDIPLMVMVADCIPILVYDPIQKVIAVIHAGRAGVFNKIIVETINIMSKNFKTKARDLNIVLGPSIRSCCYEVGEEVKRQAYKLDYNYAIKSNKSSLTLDLISIIQKQLTELNTDRTKIEIFPYCTSCRTDLFFSYRAENNLTGRFSGLLLLK